MSFPKHRVTATALNVRRGPSTDDSIIGSLSQGDIVDILAISSDQKWLKIDNGEISGWSSHKFLVEVPAATATTSLDNLIEIAATSSVATFDWANRGLAPRAYIKGMALAFGRAYCKLQAGDPFAVDMAKAVTASPTKDALAHYANQFELVGMTNESSGPTTLRHVFVLLLGLGMRESSGQWCEGRDQSASNTESSTAEAGLFQVSFNATNGIPMLMNLFDDYKVLPTNSQAVLKAVFKQGVTCSAASLQNFGTGDGHRFQELTKENPVFAAEFAAIGLRHVRTHWGPINTRKAQVRPEADRMFHDIQNAIDADLTNLSAALTV